MIQWKLQFDNSVLERGKQLYLNKRVTEFQEKTEGYSATVLGRERFSVSIKTKDGEFVRLSCSCPVSKMGRGCEHAAAVCWAIEAKKLAEKLEKDEDTVIRQWKQTDDELEKKQQEEKPTKRKRRTRAEIEVDKAAELALKKAEEEKRAEEARKAEELKRAEEQAAREREQKRHAREQRKAEKARKDEAARKAAEEMRRRLAELRAEEEARREQIRQQKTEEAARRAEKRRLEQEAQKQAEERRRIEAEKQRRAEEKRKKEYELLGAPESSDIPNVEETDRIVTDLRQYKYFDGKKILKSAGMTPELQKKAERLLGQNKLEIRKIYPGYLRTDRDLKGQMDVQAWDKRDGFPVKLLFNQNRLEQTECYCPKCRRDYYAWYRNPAEVACEYKAASVIMLAEYLDTHNLGDATDQKGNRLLDTYMQKSIERSAGEETTQKSSLRLVPKLSRKDDGLSVSFKVGAEKLYVVKQLGDFCRNVEDSATDTYGTKTEINHDINNFTDEARKWIPFIKRIVSEEEMFLKKLSESRYYSGYQKTAIGGALQLFGWRLDEYYRLTGKNETEYEDKENGIKKQMLICKDQNPEITLQISPVETDGKFHGIIAEGWVPELYMGAESSYYITDSFLCRTDYDYKDKIRNVSEMTENGKFRFQVGRNHLAEFYHHVLPELQKIMTVVETNPELIARYLLPEAQFRFYLDAENHNILCSAYAVYGKHEINLAERYLNPSASQASIFQDDFREAQVLGLMYQYMPSLDFERMEFHCDGDEDLVYRMLESGVSRLQEIGEVHCTRRFQNLNKVKHVKVSIGVSVSSGMLDLEVSTEDISGDELLEILNSYRLKKKYFRMKDGSFVDLTDQSLEMLKELQTVTGIKLRDFVKGKMHLPLYRTLYLDRMLEEHEEIYSNRDRKFREIVKGFKTIRESGFEEPESLSGIMRNYQKDGYKWMRTLEAWNLGGILADDMGLGKTLQTIAVLLAAKQEGKTGTSLIVSPAALVFNWEEEIQKFAPELHAVAVAGTQAERQKKIEAYTDADVLITSYDLLKRDIALYEEKQFEYQVIDEAQYIKNHTTSAAKAVKVIRSRIRYALTGTPIENRLSELWSIFDYLMPGFLFGYDTFRKELEIPIVKYKEEDALNRLQKLTAPFILRRLKENVLKELPDKLEESRYVRFDKTQQQLYDAQVIHMKETLAKQDDSDFNKNKLIVLAELTKLRQICCAPSLCFENYRGDAAKLEACMQLIQSAMDGGHRMLVFSQFTSMLEILQQELDKAGISYYVITGSTTKEKRLQLVKAFNEGNTPVFLISLKAGGVGLNLTGADVVIHYDPWWNVAAQNQATDRAHRIGQKKKVTVYKLIAKGTIEEKIEKLQETKKNLADQVVSGENGQLSGMSREEILELLEL